MDKELIFLACVFGVVAAAAYGLCALFLRDDSDHLKRRLRGGAAPAARKQESLKQAVADALTRMGEAVAKPFESSTHEDRSALRRRLGFAGIYAPAAVRAFVGARLMCLVVLGGAGYAAGLVLGSAMMGLSVGGLFGYMLPAIWLRMRIKHHQTALEHALPDALDLLVVCVEAGLTIDAAIQRVGREIALAHPHLAREFAIAHMETQMGLPRSEALKNLASRVGAPAVQSLVAMLVQAERLGTSIGQALRVHAESLRSRRQHAAEELAAKASVKIVFPVAMFIFPVVLMVLVGPAIIQMFVTGFIKR